MAVPEIDLEKERKKLDRLITFFHLKSARKKIERCLAISQKQDDDFFFYYFLAQKCILRHDFNKAIKYFDRALKLRKDDGCTYNDKAISLAELEKYDKALRCFDEGIRRDRDCASLYHNKGWLLNVLGRYKESVIFFKKALELEPYRAESLYSLADTFLHLNNSRDARVYFQKALKKVKGKCSFVHKKIRRQLKKIK
jgi:tetratricopeptide (TPR) repeat protein